MKIYLMDHTTLGEENKFPRRRDDLRKLLGEIPGVEMTHIIDESDLVISVMDQATSGVTVSIAYQCHSGKVWHFFPRGTNLPIPIAEVINNRAQSPDDKFKQQAFPYDSTTDIPSWVRSSLTPGGMLARFVTVPVTK